MKSPLKIKVCGMRYPENLEKVCSLGPDYVGYIFYPGSGRYVGKDPDPALFEIPSGKIAKVGVFVNEESDRVIKIFEDFQLDLVQLHGSEPPEYCGAMMNAGIPVIKSFDPGLIQVGNKVQMNSYRMEDYSELVQLILLDTPGPGWGGTGRKFDWNLIKGGSIPLPFLLSGGIGPEDNVAVREVIHEDFLGIDLNSRFELAPGFKDIQLLKEFFIKIRN